MMGNFILTVVGILILFNAEKLLALNVALNSESNSTCQPQLKPSPLTDGNKVEKAYFNNTCSQNTLEIRIKLNSSQIINYVILYGSNCSFCDQSILDYYEVDLINKDDFRIMCGTHARRYSNHGMRINCIMNFEYYKEVVIRSRPNAFGANKIVAITEIELHTLADERGLTYIGCHKGVMYDDTFKSKYRSCLEDCRKDRHPYGAMSTELGCVCTEIHPASEEELERCDNKCDGDIDFCGGYNYVSLYALAISLPQFFGCFKPANSSKLITMGEMNIEECLYRCVRDKRSLALIQDKRCFCTYSGGGKVIEPENCQIPCPNAVDKNSICGGTNAYSSYIGCEHYLCRDLVKCSGGGGSKRDEYGVCVSECRGGWNGDHCQFIETNICSMNKCDNETTTCRERPGGASVCFCKPGFYYGDSKYSCEGGIFHVVNLKIAFAILFPIVILTIIGVGLFCCMRDRKRKAEIK